MFANKNKTSGSEEGTGDQKEMMLARFAKKGHKRGGKKHGKRMSKRA